MADTFRAMCAELTERLEWFIAEDETNENDPGNQYWLTGKQAGIDSVTRARVLLAESVPVIPVKQQIFPTPSQAAECGGPCYEGSYCPEACDCGLYQPPALAQAVAEGPPAVTISNLLNPAYEITGEEIAEGAQLVDGEWWNPVMGCDSMQIVVDNARAALARWGRPTPQPPVDGEVGELVAWLRAFANGERHEGRPATAQSLASAADLLQRPTLR